ncbi:MAG TPA: M1 family aminopeptidase [Candidatus Acidoferrales bacterium]
MRVSLVVLLLLGADFSGITHRSSAAQSPAPQTNSTPQAIATQPVPTDPRALYDALNALRPDGTRVYTIKDLTLRRDVVSFTFTEGKLAFLEPLGGRITGAVFSGLGHVIATPHERGERRSLAQFIGVPILDQAFSDAYIRFDDDTAAELERQLAADSVEPSNDPAFTAHWIPLTAGLAPTHSLRTMVDWLAAEPVPCFYVLLQTNTVGPVEVSVDNRREEQVTIGQPRFTDGARSFDVWASFQAANSPATRPEAFLPMEYRVDSTIADDLSLQGKTSLHLRVGRAGERVVPMEISRQLTVDEIQGEDGQPLAYFQNEELSRRDAARRGNDFILVVLPAGKPAGADFHLQIAYHGNVITDAGNGAYFVGERGAWYAHIGGEHFTPYDLTFRWPKRLALVATGVESEAREDSDAKSGRWRSETPFPTAGFNLSQYQMANTAGQPKIQVYANKELEEAIAARLQRGAPNFVPPPSMLDRYKDADHLSGATDQPPAPSPTSALKQLGASVQDSIHFFENLNGAFPFDHLSVAQIPGSFGQGWPGLVYLSTLAFLPAETQERAGLDEWAQSEARDLMPFHEVAHQWWGNVTGAASYRDVWIEEAMANYLALWYADTKKPGQHRLTNWLEHYRAELTAKVPGTERSIEDVGPLVLGPRLSSLKVPNAYNALIYGKGTWVIHMLREMLRDPNAKDPDARFRELLRAILAEHQFRPLSTADFQHAIEQHMTPAMDLEGTHRMNWFFDQWVRGTDLPRYTVKFEVKPHGNAFIVSGRLEQQGTEDVFTAPVPLYALRIGGKPERLGVVVTTGAETRFHFESRIRPTRIVIDPNLTLLCTKG